MVLAIASCDKDSKETSGAGGAEVTPVGYVDLGLPSGTKWKADNETNPNDTCDFYTYDEAVAKFGDNLPKKEDFDELMSFCTYTWDYEYRGACLVSTINGKSIFLPATGYRGCSGILYGEGSCGAYWSKTPYDVDYAWNLSCGSENFNMNHYYGGRCLGYSVRLVHD